MFFMRRTPVDMMTFWTTAKFRLRLPDVLRHTVTHVILSDGLECFITLGATSKETAYRVKMQFFNNLFELFAETVAFDTHQDRNDFSPHNTRVSCQNNSPLSPRLLDDAFRRKLRQVGRIISQQP